MIKDNIGFLGQEGEKAKEYRCSFCGKLFFRGLLRDAVIEIRCRNCKRIGIL